MMDTSISQSRDGQGPGNGGCRHHQNVWILSLFSKNTTLGNPKTVLLINNDQALDLGSELPLESRHVSPQSVELFLRRSPLRLLVSQLPLILPLKEQLANPEKDFAKLSLCCSAKISVGTIKAALLTSA